MDLCGDLSSLKTHPTIRRLETLSLTWEGQIHSALLELRGRGRTTDVSGREVFEAILRQFEAAHKSKCMGCGEEDAAYSALPCGHLLGKLCFENHRVCPRCSEDIIWHVRVVTV